MSEDNTTRQIIVGIAGPWEEPRDLMRALTDAHGAAYLFAGRVLMETESRISCQLDWFGHHEQMREAYELAGYGRLDAGTLDAIEAHNSTAYLLFDDPGYETARTAARFTAALLGAGGIAPKVETAGIAHPREHWIRKSASDDPFDIYSLFIQLVGDEELLYSCGMQNFGLPDAAVAPAVDVDAAAYLLNVFNLYRIAEAPVLNDGETFSADAESPRYRLSRGPYLEDYDPGEPLYNPHGLWTLRPAGDPPAPRSRRWSFRG